MNPEKVRVRFAPSPTGPLHMGGVRTALYNYLFAKNHGGTFILRIEDTDRSRYVSGAEEHIVQSLMWCGILPDEGPGSGGDAGPYRQSERKHLYRSYAEELVKAGNAYYAFDTPEELEAMRNRLKEAKVASPQYNGVTRERMKNSLSLSADAVQESVGRGIPYVIRLKTPRNEEIRFHDIIRGWVTVHSSHLDDKVLFKSDGMPTYHLANVVDDHLMNISHVIRGEEWLPSAPAHVLLYRSFGWETTMPLFAHLPLILRPDGNGKLSKRDADKLGIPVYAVEWKDTETGEKIKGYREEGYFPEAFINMLAFLGWNPGTTQELFSKEELSGSFSLERTGKAGARFDPDKAKWYNQQYLRMKSDEEIMKLTLPFLEDREIVADQTYISKVCGLMKERASFIRDIFIEGSYFFSKPSYDKKLISKKWNQENKDHMEKLTALLHNADPFNAATLEEAFKTYADKQGLPSGRLLPLLRFFLTGVMAGPSVFEIAALLGKNESLARIKEGLKTADAIPVT